MISQKRKKEKIERKVSCWVYTLCTRVWLLVLREHEHIFLTEYTKYTEYTEYSSIQNKTFFNMHVFTKFEKLVDVCLYSDKFINQSW